MSDPGGEPRLLTAPEQEFRIRELLAAQAPGSGRRPCEGPTRPGFARQVRVRSHAPASSEWTPNNWLRSASRLGALLGGAGQILRRVPDVLDAEQVIDYAELIHRARVLVSDPEIADEVGRWFGASGWTRSPRWTPRNWLWCGRWQPTTCP